MFNNIEFDFENTDYVYHETDYDSAIEILENGLYIEGTNIIDAKNVIETTTLPLPSEDLKELEEIFLSEKSISSLRVVNAIVIIGSPKEQEKHIAVPFEEEYEGRYYPYVIPNYYVVGFCDLERKMFYANPYYDGYDVASIRM